MQAIRSAPADLSTAGIRAFTERIEANPANSLAYSERGFEHELLGHHDEAIADYTRAIELNRSENRYFHNRGMIFLRKGDIDKAISDLNESIKLDSSFKQSYLGLSDAYRAKSMLVSSSNLARPEMASGSK